MAATLTVRIAADINSFSKNLSKVEKDFVRAAKRIESVGKDLSIAVTAPLLAMGAAFAKSAADDAASVDRLKRVFGGAANEMEGFIKQVMKTIPETDDALRELTGTTQNFLTQLGIAPRAAVGMTETLTKLAADMAAFNHVDIGTALDALEKGLAGKTKGLQTLGVVISEQMVKQEAYRLGLAKVGTELSQSATAHAALSLIMQKMGNQTGEAARTAGDASKSWAFFKQSIDNLSDSMGTVLIPVMSRVIGIATGAANRISEMGTTAKLTTVIFGGMAAAIGPLLLGLASLSRAIVVLRASALGLGGSLAVGAAVIVGLGLLALWLAKSGEAARNAKADAENYRSSLAVLTADQLKWQQALAKSDVKIAQTALTATPKFRNQTNARTGEVTALINPDFTEATRKLQAAQEKLAGVQTAIDTLNDTAPPTSWVPPTIVDLGAAKKAFQEFADKAHAALDIFDSLASHGEASDVINSLLVASYDKVQAKLREMGDVASVARAELIALGDALKQNIVISQHIASINSTGSVGPLIGKTLPTPQPIAVNHAVDDAIDRLRHGPMAHAGGADPIVKLPDLTKDAIDKAQRNAEMLRDTIANTAAQTAQIIGSALLQFGNGSRASQIGGALGSAIGGGAGGYLGGLAASAVGGITGAAIGSVVPVIGTIVGGFIGSAIGGLFGHAKKATEQNTAALKQLTQALVQNAPSGFKVERYRFNATDATMGKRPAAGSGGIYVAGDLHVYGVTDLKELDRAVRKRGTRGGAPILTPAAA